MRRWLVLDVDSRKKIIQLQPAKGGQPPTFGGESGWVHDRIRQEMLEVYKETNIPVFLDAKGRELLLEARENFNRYRLDNHYFLAQGNTTYLFCWMGDRIMDTVVALLRTQDVKASNEGIAIAAFNSSPDQLKKYFNALVQEGLPDTYKLAESIANKAREKYDLFLTDELLSANYAALKLDGQGALDTMRAIIQR